MTIRPGEPWGETIDRPVDLVVVSSDAELAERVDRIDVDDGPTGLDGGDLHASLGAPGFRSPVQRLPIDLLRVRVNGQSYVAVAHVVMRRRSWMGPIVAVMNVDRVGPFNVAPRAHPNDGRFDIIEVAAAMPARQRVEARKRLRHGTHVPHDAITVRRATTESWRFERDMQIWIDGVRRCSARNVEIQISPDAASVDV